MTPGYTVLDQPPVLWHLGAHPAAPITLGAAKLVTSLVDSKIRVKMLMTLFLNCILSLNDLLRIVSLVTVHQFEGHHLKYP